MSQQIGLHERDTEKLIGAFRKLKQEGNSVIVVEHDGQIIRSADWIIDMGPGAGEAGGEIIFEGTAKKLLPQKLRRANICGGRKKFSTRKIYRKATEKKSKFLERGKII